MKRKKCDKPDLDDAISNFEQYSEMWGEDLFSISILNNLKEIKEYLKFKAERDEELKYYASRGNEPSAMVCEPFPEYESEKPITLGFDEIIDYANSLSSPDDVKSIMMMLYKLVGRKCSEEQYEQIGQLGCKKEEKPLIGHADQVVVGNKGKTAYYRDGKEK